MADRPGTIPQLRITQVLASSTGGVGRHVASLARGLIERGGDVTVAGPAATEELFGFAARGARLTPVEIGPSPRPVADTTAVLRLRRLLRRAEVVHAHGLRAALLAGLALRPPGGPPLPARFVVTWHNVVLSGPLRHRMIAGPQRWIARVPDVTLTASHDLAEQVHALGGRDVRPGPVAAPPLPPPDRPLEALRQEVGAEGRPWVLAVGRLEPQKGFDVLVEAAAPWSERIPAPLVTIAGDGPLEDPLCARITAIGAPVRLLGRRSDVADLLAGADIVVLPSRWEARALVAQEACWAGRPVVATAVGGLPDLLGDAALLVPSEDPSALRAAVERLLDDPGEAARLARRARERAASWPTVENTVQRVAAVYQELVGERGW